MADGTPLAPAYPFPLIRIDPEIPKSTTVLPRRELDSPGLAMADGTPPATTYPEPAWAMFDHKAIISDLANATRNSTTSIECQTSAGRTIRVSLDLAAPPDISYAHVQMAGWTMNHNHSYGIPLVIGCDRNLLLVKMSVPKGDWSSTIDLFVYNAAADPPSLSRLPSCPFDNPRSQTTGIVCHGKEYAVVTFHKKFVDFHSSIAAVAVYRSKSTTEYWDTKELFFPDSDQGIGPVTWQPDVVIPFSEQRSMCWVDYSKGILFYSVLDELPVTTFHQFPATQITRLRRHCLRENRRTACISQGKLRFVDVNNGGNPPQDSASTVSKWTLRMSGGVPHSWEEDNDALQVDRLWGLKEYQQIHLHRWTPEYPVVSKQDHHIVHFVVQDLETFAHAWSVTIDMRTMELLSSVPYTDGEEDDTRKNVYFTTAFFSIELPKYHKMLLGFASEGKVAHFKS